MADPKYANLPGIDVNSPDVFETSDLPEDEQALAKPPEELESESVETVALDTKAAYTAFKGKGVSSTVDFSDSVGKSRKAGYFSDQTEYELSDGSTLETPLQKFQRLQHEIRELTEEVSKAKESVKGDGGPDKLSPVNLGQQLQYLQHQLTDLHLEKLLGPDASVDLSDPQGALRQRLLQQLSSYTPPAASKDKPSTPQAGGGQGDYVTYELYYRPEQAQFSKNARMANLEERLERLENAIGQSMDKVGVLTGDTENKSLLGAVGALNTKLSLLDQPNVDAVEARLQSVLHKLNQIADKKTALETPERQQKVSELYELVKKWEAVGDSLPQVVDRMVALKDLHEQALQFSQALTYLDTAQQEVKSNLDTHSDMLKKLQGSFKGNMDGIKSNFDSLDKRMQVLKK
ncbi:dynactin subunit 2-like isoform X2 [Littorina saxatilis]|uniref:Dynactin subunit 2 n=1 Tax=Littorina saxatilis TaxID=31220 RepID=A0AAN9BQ37_9CAEN